MKRLQDPTRRLMNDRIDFSKVSGKYPLPNLVSIQVDSYRWFLTEGIEEVFKDVFPVQSYSKDVTVNYVSYHIEEPKYSFLECKQRGLTYSAPLKVKFSLEVNATGEVKENEIFVCDLNLMTHSGTFIVNGAERVIVSQIVRSPGAYMSRELDKSGHYTYKADLNPSRGTWLNFENDTKNILSLRIDRQKKMNATLLLKALGLTDSKAIIDLFDVKPTKKVKAKKGQEKELTPLELTLQKDENVNTELDALEAIFRKLKPGEPISEEGIIAHLYQKFFDPKRYDLGKAGRYKFNSKLGIYERLLGAILAENLVDVTGEVVYEKETQLTKVMIDDLRAKRFFENGLTP